jgi:hypothetical protein
MGETHAVTVTVPLIVRVTVGPFGIEVATNAPKCPCP